MPQLIPVDHDPFSGQPAGNSRVTPVDYDPFGLNGSDKGSAVSVAQGFNSAVPFGNRITAGGAALALAPFTEETISELYDTARANQKATEQAHPTANLIGSIGGIVATLPIGLAKSVASTPVLGRSANALSKSAKAAGNFVRGAENSSQAARALRGAAVAAPSGAIYGYGAGDEGKRFQAAALGAGLGAAGAITVPVAGAVVKSAVKGAANVAKGIAARSPEELQNIARSIKNTSIGFRNQMQDMGAKLNENAGASLATNLDAKLNGLEIIPELSPKTLAIVKRIKENIAEGPLDLNKLDQYRRLLRNARDEDSAVAGAVRSAIDDTINGLTERDFASGGTKAVDLLNKFRKGYAQGSKFEDVADVLAKADGDPNKIKSGLARFLQNSDNTKGYSQQEMLLLKEAAQSSAPEKVLKMFGKFGIDLGTSFGPGNTVLPAATAFVNPLIPVGGTIARQGQKYLARGKAEKLMRALEQVPDTSSQDFLRKYGQSEIGKTISKNPNLPIQKFKDMTRDQFEEEFRKRKTKK